MLAENALNFMLFQYGYLGRENIYEYWMENKNGFIGFINKFTPGLLSSPDILDAFEAKVRWKSPIGSLMAEEVRRQVRHLRQSELNLEDLTILYGKERYKLKEFTDKHELRTASNRTHDLRGISILNTTFKGCVLKDADLSFACLDGNTFEQGRFDNCHLSQSTIRRSVLETVCFDSQTTINRLELNKSTLKQVAFEGDCQHLKFSPLKGRHSLDLLWDLDSKYPRYTFIENSSCRKSEPSMDALMVQQKVIQSARAIQNEKSRHRIVHVVPLIMEMSQIKY